MSTRGLPTTGILGGSIGLPTEGILRQGVAQPISTTGFAPATLPDNGGVEVTVTGIFPTVQGIACRVENASGSISRPCFSGVLGQADVSFSTDGTTLVFWVPPMPLATDHKFVLTPVIAGPIAEVLNVPYIHRTFVTNLFSIRSIAAQPRNVGPQAIEDED